MKQFKFWKYTTAILYCMLSITFTSCNDDEPQNSLKINPDKVELATQQTATVTIDNGVAPFTVTSSDAKIVTATVKDNTITLTGVKEGTATIAVNDKNNLTGKIAVLVKTASVLTFDKESVEVANGEEATINISGGNAPYTATVEDASIATATVKDATVTIKGLKEGSTTLSVTDNDKETGTISITVKK